MGQSIPFSSPKLSQPALDAVCDQLLEAAEYMADDQILCVADALHETLRERRQMRRRVHQRVEERLCGAGGGALPC